MTEPQPATLKLGFHAAVIGRQRTRPMEIGKTLGRLHYLTDMLRIVLPVSSNMQNSARLELMTKLLDKIGLDKPSLVVALFVPGVRKEYLHLV